MNYVFENYNTQELFMSPDFRTIFHRATSEIRFALDESITHGRIYAVAGDSPFDEKIKTVCTFPSDMMYADVADTYGLSVRGYLTARKNGLYTAEQIAHALRDSKPLRCCGVKTRREWREYVRYCAVTPDVDK